MHVSDFQAARMTSVTHDYTHARSYNISITILDMYIYILSLLLFKIEY